MTVFERHPKLTLIAVAAAGLIVLLAITELTLRLILGLGTPLLYRSSPLFGYRLQPNQVVHRRGAEIRVNNLGLRADRDWDGNIDDKILFLGNSVTFGGTSISNDRLFSHLSAEGIAGYVSGNAGVNGWGIENIAALVVDYKFLPARTYVSVLQEMDFYRGLSKLAGKPFWTSPPQLAIQELLGAFYVDRLNSMYTGNDRFVSALENEKAVEHSCARLKLMDQFLKSQGFNHRIYMSTNIYQLFDGAPADSIVQRYLKQFDIHPTYIKEQPELSSLPQAEQRELFYDWNHLNEKGHAVWAKIINKDLRRLLSLPAHEPTN